jgi:hypothetical protein
VTRDYIVVPVTPRNTNSHKSLSKSCHSHTKRKKPGVQRQLFAPAPVPKETALERAAIAANRRGESWGTFWERHAAAIRQAEPWDRAAYHRLVQRLMHLVATGDRSGQFGVGDWEADDAAWRAAQ